MKIRRAADGGMSLLEIIIAMAIVAIAVVGALSLVAFSTGTDQAAKERMIAMDNAKTVMEQIQNTAYDDIFTNFNGYAFDAGNLRPVDGDSDNKVGRVVVDNTDPELLNIQVLVEWNGMNGNTDVRFRTLMTRK